MLRCRYKDFTKQKNAHGAFIYIAHLILNYNEHLFVFMLCVEKNYCFNVCRNSKFFKFLAFD